MSRYLKISIAGIFSKLKMKKSLMCFTDCLFISNLMLLRLTANKNHESVLENLY